MSNLYYVDWFVMLLSLYGYYLIGIKNKLGFVVGIFGSLLGVILFTIISFNIPLTIMYICFFVLNIKGYLNWKK